MYMETIFPKTKWKPNIYTCMFFPYPHLVLFSIIMEKKFVKGQKFEFFHRKNQICCHLISPQKCKKCAWDFNIWTKQNIIHTGNIPVNNIRYIVCDLQSFLYMSLTWLEIRVLSLSGCPSGDIFDVVNRFRERFFVRLWKKVGQNSTHHHDHPKHNERNVVIRGARLKSEMTDCYWEFTE